MAEEVSIKEEEITSSSSEEKSARERDYFHTKEVSQPKKSIWMPGKITEYLFSIFLVLSLIVSLFNVPLASLMSSTASSASFKVGYPWAFFEVNTENPEKMPLKIGGLLGDFLLYFIVAYVIEVLVNWIMSLFERKNKKIPQNKQEIIRKAKEAYEYYRAQGISEENLFSLFKERGWSEEDIIVYLK